jgi:hypothetical protein
MSIAMAANLGFGCGFAASIGVMLFGINQLCKELNRVLPADEQVRLGPRSVRDLLLGGNFLTRSLLLLGLHDDHYPSSSLRRIIVIAAIGACVSFVGVALSDLLM